MANKQWITDDGELSRNETIVLLAAFGLFTLLCLAIIIGATITGKGW